MAHIVIMGAGIGGLLFGGGFMHGGIGGFFGMLIQFFLIAMVVRFVWRLFTRNRAPAFAGPAGMMGRTMQDDPGMAGGTAGGMGGGAAPRGPAYPPLAIGPADYQSFERLLQTVQELIYAHKA